MCFATYSIKIYGERKAFPVDVDISVAEDDEMDSEIQIASVRLIHNKREREILNILPSYQIEFIKKEIQRIIGEEEGDFLAELADWDEADRNYEFEQKMNAIEERTMEGYRTFFRTIGDY